MATARLEKRPPPLEGRDGEGHNGPVFGHAFSPDGKTVATAGVDGKVMLWDTETGQKRGPPVRPGSRERAWSVVQLVAAAGRDLPNRAHVLYRK